MRQTWSDLTFLHWPYPIEEVRRLLPEGLELDVFDGSAWIGLVPFFITNLTLPKASSLPWVSSFAETNVRTYVADAKGRRGVWFFSLDAARLLAVAGARATYALPYYWAKMRVRSKGFSVAYSSQRRHGPAAGCDIEVRIGKPVPEPSELEIFLTARFRLYAWRNGRLIQAGVDHAPWPLQRASVTRLQESLISAAGLSRPASDPLAHFSRRVDVLVGGPAYI